MEDYININYIDEIKDSFKLTVTCKSLDAKLKTDVKKVCDECGFTFENMTSNIQIHSDIVNIVDEKNIGDKIEGDALITNLKNVPLLVFTADCVPIYIIDNKNKAIGLIHSGWRGTYSEISKKTIEKMEKLYNSKPEDLICIIGPSIGPCCYEVSEELIDKFVNKFKNFNDNIYIEQNESVFLNLWSLNEYILKDSGVKDKNIHNMNLCTSCKSDEFHSYRKDNKTLGRIGNILEIK